MKMNEWEHHYQRDRSLLLYPDEQLVRMLKPFVEASGNPGVLRGVDLGCGTGRHVRLLRDLGIKQVAGIDLSHSALVTSRKHIPGWYLQSSIDQLPFTTSSIHMAIAWGSLHYTDKERTPVMLKEIHRILRPEGYLFGTLRSCRDTHTRRGRHIGNNTWKTDRADIHGARMSFFDEEELTSLFSIFDSFEYGLMERTLIGSMDTRISHWFYRAAKKA
ncbi:MAG: class I SAM-dependent methyltransferase [Spirochaetota bacterium]